MISNHSIEKMEQSRVKLSITVDKETAKKEFDKILQKYCKTAHIKGFRKGKVPASILLQKYGESLNYEASMNLVEEALKKIFEEIEQKPLGYASPELLDEIRIEEGQDFAFSVAYDVFPEIKTGEYKGVTIEIPEVKVDKKDIDSELARLQDQNAVVQDKADGLVEQDSIVTVDYAELGEDQSIIDGTQRQDFVFTVGTGYNYYKIDEDVIGMKKDEEKIVEKSYPEDFEIKELAGSTRSIKVKVTAVKEKNLPEIDDELAQDISDKFKTLKDLKDDVKEKLEKQLSERLKAEKTEKILNSISEGSEIDLPESMINTELDSQWQNMMMQYRMQEEQMLKLLEMQGKSKEMLLADWREDVKKSLRKQLIVAHLADKEDIKVSDEDYQAMIEKQSAVYNLSPEDFTTQIEKNSLKQHIMNDVRNEKLIEMLIDSATIKKGKKKPYAEFMNQS